MAKLSRELSVGTLHPRENLFLVGILGALNAELQTDCDSASTVSLDLRGTFSHTVQVQGSIDGTNWTLIPMRSALGGAFVLGIVGTVSGIWMGSCTGYRKVRAIVTAYTSGGSTATLMASNALFDDFAKNGSVTALIGTVTAAADVAATLTLAAPGVGLRQYLTYLRITKFAAALLTPAATPILVTTTNLPGTPVFSLPADAATQGTVFAYQEDFAYPLMASAQNTALTVVAPLTTGVIWRITAGYFVAP
jgi:hypothetical protein